MSNNTNLWKKKICTTIITKSWHEKFVMYVGKGPIILKGATCITKSKACESFLFFHKKFEWFYFVT
jgi:hypothetical protein